MQDVERNVADDDLRRRGQLTSSVGEGGAFFRSRPDLTLAVTLVRVASRGSLRLRSADPTWAPAVDGGCRDARGLPTSWNPPVPCHVGRA